MIKSALSPSNVKLIQDVLNNKSNGHITILFDGYDEVHEKNENRMHNLFKLLLKSKHIRLVVSVRNHRKNALKNFLRMHKFNVGYSTLQPFNSRNITEYLARSWMENLECDINSKFYTYSKFLIEKFYSLCSVPLMVKMMSEIYKTGFQKFKASYIKDKESEISYLEREFLEVDHIYEIFINHCLLLKVKDVCNGVGIVSSNNQILEGFYLDHQLLAIEFLDVGELKFILKNPKYMKKLDFIQGHHLIQFEKSILVKFVDDKVFFSHHSYAEYFVANFLWDDFIYLKNIVKKVLSFFPAIRKFFIQIIEKNIELFVSKLAQETSFVSRDVVIWACECNAVELLKYVLPKTYFFRPNGTKMLQIAIKNGSDKISCQHGRREIVEILIREKVNIGALTKKKSTPLHFACRDGHKEVVEILIREKANIEALNQDNWTPLHLACQNGHKEVVKILIRGKANIEALTQDNWTPLHLVCQHGRREVVEILIREKVNIGALTKKKCTPLHFACQNGHKEVVEILIRGKANIEALTQDNWTPFHLACQNGHKEVVEILIRGKANIEALTQDNWTPFHLACQNGHKEVVEILIRGKANIEALTQDNWTPLHLACCNDHKEIVETLIREKVNIGALTKKKATALHLACHNGHKEMAEKPVPYLHLLR
nr:ankyrin-1-like [Aedes albopictus]